jgi:hypothetical protein
MLRPPFKLSPIAFATSFVCRVIAQQAWLKEMAAQAALRNMRLLKGSTAKVVSVDEAK